MAHWRLSSYFGEVAYPTAEGLEVAELPAAAPVDVLAVLDRIAGLPLHECDDARNQAALQIAKRDAAEARAAVAELVEATKWADRMIAQHARNEDGQTLDTSPLRAALTRCGGAA